MTTATAPDGDPNLEAITASILLTAHNHARRAAEAASGGKAREHIAATLCALDAYYQTPDGIEVLARTNAPPAASPALVDEVSRRIRDLTPVT